MVNKIRNKKELTDEQLDKKTKEYQQAQERFTKVLTQYCTVANTLAQTAENYKKAFEQFATAFADTKAVLDGKATEAFTQFEQRLHEHVNAFKAFASIHNEFVRQQAYLLAEGDIFSSDLPPED